MNRRNMLIALVAGTTAGGALGGVFGANLAGWPFSLKVSRQPLLIAGSGTMFALNRALADEFYKTHPSVDIVVEKGGSLPGLIALKRGAIDLAAIGRDVTMAEDDDVRDFLIARNDITIVVHKKSPIGSLSSTRVRAIFTGEIDNWKQIGGPDAPVHVISRTRGSTSREFVEEVVLEGDDITPNAREMADTRQLAEAVAADPFAIGYVALKDRAGIADIASLAVDGVAASRATILSGRYPYTNSLYLAMNGEQPGPAADFVAFARSAEGQRIVEQQRLVAVC